MDILFYSVAGVLAGTLASALLKTKTFPGLLMDIVLGLFGGIAGGVFLYLIGQTSSPDQDIQGIAIILAGSLIWISIGRLFKFTDEYSA